MTQSITIETAKRNLDALIEQMRTGDTITLTKSDGEPVAVIMPMETAQKMEASEWQARWDAMVEKVSRSWTSDKSALEVLQEMRR